MPVSPDLPQTELLIMALTNAFRQEHSLAPVTPNRELAAAARWFADYLATSGKFAHEADGREPQQRAEAHGYQYCMVAENLALHLDSRGYTTDRLAREVVEGWKGSPPHRRAMLEKAATEIGIAVVRAPAPDPKFLSVQLFGRPQSLKIGFSIRNETGSTVTYRLAEETHSIEPRTIVTHESCSPGDIVFDRAGNWLNGTRIDLSFEQREGALFAIRPAGSGRLRIDVETARGN